MNVEIAKRAAIDRKAGQAKVRCRQITPDDFPAVADLLVASFSRRDRAYWERVLRVLAGRPAIGDYPRFGYMLESGGKAVGVMLLLFSRSPSGDIRCNGSSWCVDPAFRGYGVSLISQTLKHRVTHTNLSPADNAAPIFEALGYRRFCNGLFATAPLFAGGPAKVRVGGVKDADAAPAQVRQLLRDHEGFGCLSLWCETEDGQGAPFVFRRRFVRALPGVPAAQLIYTESMEAFVRLAGPLARHLALRFMPFIIVQADGPIQGLPGRYFDNRPMFFRGGSPPGHGDLAWSEMAMFGI